MKRYKPNVSIKALRKALGMNQRQFAELTGFSLSHTTSVEVGCRPVTYDYALAVAVKTGVIPESIMSPSTKAKDCLGRTYSIASYKTFCKAYPEELSGSYMEKIISPIKVAIEAAADAGRLRIFTQLLNTAVNQSVQAIDGVQGALDKRQYTYEI